MGNANLGGRSIGGVGCEDEQARWDALLSSLPPAADEPVAAPLTVDLCGACEGEGRVEGGSARWSAREQAYVSRGVCCAACTGTGWIALPLPALDLGELTALDAAADDAEGRVPSLVSALGDALVDLAAAFLAGVAEVILVAASVADERDGASVAAAGRDEPATRDTRAPVLELRRTAPSRRAA